MDMKFQNHEKRNAEIQEKLRHLIDEKAEIAIVEGYKPSDEEVLGILISQHCKWDGNLIFKVAQEAFEDANFHSFNKKFEQLWEKESDG